MKDSNSQRGGFTFWQVALVLATLAFLAAVLIPVFGRSREPGGRRRICPSNLKQISLGFKQYVQDYDAKYPPIALDAQIVGTPASTFGWADSLYPYVKSKQILQCNLEKNGPNSDPTQSGYTDYWFNARMAGKSERVLDEQALTVAMGDGASSNARYHLWGIPRSWMGNTASPLYRHVEGANYAFVDGHTKWLRPKVWKDGVGLGKNGFTFRITPTR